MAPPNKAGLIISYLFDGELVTLLAKRSWYLDFKEKLTELMIVNLEKSIYPGIGNKIIFKDTASPKTIMRMFNSYYGAITGWSLEGKNLVPNSLLKITSTPKTKILNVFKAGQWSYSPSGVPVSILTGRIAAKEVALKLKK